MLLIKCSSEFVYCKSSWSHSMKRPQLQTLISIRLVGVEEWHPFRKVSESTDFLEAAMLQQVTSRFDQSWVIWNLHSKMDQTKASFGQRKPFTIGQFVFNSPANVAQRFDNPRLQDPSVGLGWDLFGALINMTSKNHDGPDRSNELYSADRIKSKVSENDDMSTMDHDLPAPLFSKSGTRGGTVSRDKGLEACTSYDKWNQDFFGSPRL